MPRYSLGGLDTVGVVVLHADLGTGVSGASGNIGDTADTLVIAAPGTGFTLYITSLLVSNAHPSVGTVVDIKNGLAGPVIYRGYAINAGGGFSCSFTKPLELSMNTGLYAANQTVGSGTYVSAAGFFV